MSFDNQCDLTWTLKKEVELIPLFQTTSFNIEKDALDLFGGVEGRMFTFEVKRVREVKVCCPYTPAHTHTLYLSCRLNTGEMMC